MVQSQRDVVALAVHLVKRGALSPDQLVQSLDALVSQHPPIGRVAMRSRKLTVKQVCDVLARQAELGLRFGETAILMGYLDEADVGELLRLQREQTATLPDVVLRLGFCGREALDEALRTFANP